MMERRGWPETDVPSGRGEKPGQRRRPHSSRRSGKPVTGRRGSGDRHSRIRNVAGAPGIVGGDEGEIETKMTNRRQRRGGTPVSGKPGAVKVARRVWRGES